ncbi:calcium-binding EF hand family protein [Tasmannia lanceolata]|uniref:calcium-binding EF hand family protein n=1 Tax=Tasmannia lanceolata TaxID=3420 RepID=UPI0040630169
MAPAVVYPLLATVFLLFLTFSPAPHVGPPHRPYRRLVGPKHIALDPTFRIEGGGISDRALHENFNIPVGWVADPFSGNFADMEEYFSEESPLNITERLTILFPLLDRLPKDGGVSFVELEAWNIMQALNRLAYRTKREIKERDRNGDGAIALREYLSQFSEDEIEWNNTAHGQAGWWKEQFINADIDGNGLLNYTEFNDFLHPEDSKNAKIQQWMQKAKIRDMDHDQDGKLSFSEFRDRAYDIYKNYVEFEKGDDDQLNHIPSPEEKFAELDTNKDKYLTENELEPIIHHLYPGELSYATYYTKYLMHEADDDNDGKLTLKEILDHQYAFYSTVYEDSETDEDDEHDEL